MTFSEAHPIVWATGKALLAGTFSAHWVDMMATGRLSQLVKDSLSFLDWNAEACLCGSTFSVCAYAHVCASVEIIIIILSTSRTAIHFRH